MPNLQVSGVSLPAQFWKRQPHLSVAILRVELSSEMSSDVEFDILCGNALAAAADASAARRF
ncbi:hypothetical protein [Mycolicibacterium lutetiense]